MSTTTAPSTAPAPAGTTGSTGFSFRRLAALTRWNAVLLGRNRLALVYGTVLPMISLLFLLSGEKGDPVVGASGVGGVLLMAGLFPVFYNVLSQFVNRRDELVLKRMRTGEARDSELALAIALPGIAIAFVLCAVTVPLAVALGQDLPINPFMFIVGATLSAVMFAALAYWTAAWTRTTEAAQLTSLPVILLAVVGQVGIMLTGLPDAVREAISYTPGSALTELVRAGWFGLDGTSATESTLSFSETWAAAGQPMLVMAAWTVAAIWIASRSMRWEPRT